MKNQIVILAFCLCGCTAPHPENLENLDNEVDTNLYKPINIDSISNVAHQTLIKYRNQMQSNQTKLDCLSNEIRTTKDISSQDKAIMLNEIQHIQSQKQDYESQLNEYKNRKITRRDTTIYNIRFIDTTIYKKDTIVIYDTIRQTIFKKGYKKAK